MSGFSLVEVLVALVIGMLATIVVLQMFTDSESRNRTSSGSADAQSNGLMTLYQMQSNIQRAGFGLNSMSLFNCNVKWKINAADEISKAVTLAPVVINPKDAAGALKIPAGDANTDVLVVMFGNGNSQPEGNTISATTGSVYTVPTPSMFALGDRVIATPTSATKDPCVGSDLSIDRITATSSTAPGPVTAASPGIAASAPNLPILYNLGPGPNGPNTTPSAAMPTNGPTILAYAVRNGSLTVCDFNIDDCSKDDNKKLASVWVPVASNIVSMRAVYWWDDSAAWNVAAPVDPKTQPINACEWARVKAINLVLVARSDERDKTVVTTTSKDGATANAPTWSQAAIAPLVGASGAVGPDKVADEDWKHYRYKTFQAFIPLRNVTWMGSPPTGCP
jgi:type IV pilus assembly protein PilW